VNNKNTKMKAAAKTGLGKYRERPQMFLLVFANVKLQAKLNGSRLPWSTSQDEAFKQAFNTSYKKSPLAVVSWEEIDTENMKICPHFNLSFF